MKPVEREMRDTGYHRTACHYRIWARAIVRSRQKVVSTNWLK